VGKTFEDIYGNVCKVNDCDGVEFDEDIITGKISRYYTVCEGEEQDEISEEVYNVLKTHYE
jgi:hypothetical protein